MADVPANLGVRPVPTTPEGRCAPPPQNESLPKPGTRRHPAPGTLLKKVPRFRQKKSLLFSVLLVLSSWSFKEPGQQDDQDGENKLLDLGEMQVCISGLTLTRNPNPQKNTNFLKGLGFRVRVSSEKQTLDLGEMRVCFSGPPHRTTHPLEDDSL